MNGSKNFFHLCNHQLSFCILINEFSIENLPWELKSDSEVIDYIFEKLKAVGFNFDYRTRDNSGAFRGDNYGNYSLPDITLKDFRLINQFEGLTTIDSYIESILKRNIEWYNKLRGEIFSKKIFGLIEYCIKSPKYWYELSVDVERTPEKKHKFYSLYEHFKSFILFYNDNNKENVVYIEIAYG